LSKKRKETEKGLVIVNLADENKEKKLRAAAHIVEDDYPELAKIILSRESEAAEC